MERKPLSERLREIQSSGLSKEEIFKTLYLERYPIFEITEALGVSSDELKEIMVQFFLGNPFPEPSPHQVLR